MPRSPGNANSTPQFSGINLRIGGWLSLYSLLLNFYVTTT